MERGAVCLVSVSISVVAMFCVFTWVLVRVHVCV